MAFRTNKTPVLQEKSASGAVVTFNTALAMPLASCNIAVNATQSGSGVSAINISATGKNLFNKATVTLGKWLTNTGAEHNSQNGAYSDYIPIVTNIPYYFSHIIGLNSFHSIAVYDENKTFINTIGLQGGNDTSGTVTFTQGSYIRVNIYRTYLDICQIEIGSTPTAFESFGTQTTINIGQTVNEATYNALTGVMEVTQPIVQTIQLPPCPIDTLEGVNNIWADTGDVDLTYKDLDIAKRGNFREVFRLPS